MSGARYSYPQIIGAMSTPTSSSQLARRNEGLTTYIFVSTFNFANPNAPYRFGSDNERMQYNLGRSYAICGANLQNQ
jgi:hypothetical protein